MKNNINNNYNYQIYIKRVVALCSKEKNGEKRSIKKEDIYEIVKNNPQLFKNTSLCQEKALMLFPKK